MSFTSPRFTDEGKALQAKAQAGTALKFTKMQLGDGELGSQAIAAMTGLVNPLITVGISGVKAGNNYATVKSNFSNSGLTTGFYWREIGVFAADPEKPNDRNSDILYCYANAGSLAEYIPAAGSEIVEKIISIPCIIGDAENVSAEVESGIYATKEELKEHIDNKNNPHGVTAKQIGALTEETLTKTAILNKIRILDIANGGTGANTKKEAFDNLAFLGYNPISSPDEDTTAKWCELGNGYAWFDTDGLMINQPNQYMFVINYTRGKEQDNDVFQIGSGQNSGTVYYRTGNGRSWYMNWTPLFGANSTVPIANGGTGTRDAQSAFINLGQRAVMGSNTEVNSPNQAGCYAANGWRQIAAANDIPGISNYGILDNKYANGNFMQMFMCNNSYGDYGLYVRAATDSTDIKNLEWQRVYTSRNAASLIQNLLKGGSISVVKSVQRGTLKLIDASSATTSVTISSINMNKSFLLIDGQNYTAGSAGSFNASGKIKNNTTLEFTPTFERNERYNYEINWQVVEYY